MLSGIARNKIAWSFTSLKNDMLNWIISDTQEYLEQFNCVQTN